MRAGSLVRGTRSRSGLEQFTTLSVTVLKDVRGSSASRRRRTIRLMSGRRCRLRPPSGWGRSEPRSDRSDVGAHRSWLGASISDLWVTQRDGGTLARPGHRTSRWWRQIVRVHWTAGSAFGRRPGCVKWLIRPWRRRILFRNWPRSHGCLGCRGLCRPVLDRRGSETRRLADARLAYPVAALLYGGPTSERRKKTPRDRKRISGVRPSASTRVYVVVRYGLMRYQKIPRRRAGAASPVRSAYARPSWSGEHLYSCGIDCVLAAGA